MSERYEIFYGYTYNHVPKMDTCSTITIATPESLWREARREIHFGRRVEPTQTDKEVVERGRVTAEKCVASQRSKDSNAAKKEVSWDRALHLARFCEHLPLAEFTGYMELVPTLVNVVTCAAACIGAA